MRMLSRFLLPSLFVAVAGLASAGTISLTDPTPDDYLGRTNTVRFLISDANAKVTVRVELRQVADPSVVITTQREFTPNADKTIDGSIPLNLSPGLANGAYTLKVTATEPGATYNTLTPINVTVDVKDPRFLQFNPIDGGFVRGLVPITALFDEDNMKEWRVQVDNADIPNNVGTDVMLSTTWDSTLEVNDGPKTITISAEDLAGNKSSVSVTITVDRNPPSALILSPTTTDVFYGNARIPVVVEITDQFNNAVDARTIDVVIEDLQGNLIGRVARRSVQNNGSKVTFSGRIRDISSLPSEFNIVVHVSDRAGNAAAPQAVKITKGRGIMATYTVSNNDEPASETVRVQAKLWFKQKFDIVNGRLVPRTNK